MSRIASQCSLETFREAPENRVLAMLCLSLAVFIASLDTAITNTALPTISAQLGSSAADVIWVVTSYQLIMVAAMLPLAALADKIGHRKVFAVGLGVFTLTSLFCGLANSLEFLVAARAAQGLGAAAIMGVNTALVKQIYPSASLGKGLGLNALVVALGLAGGPVVASGVLAVGTWHWLFFLNLPIGIAALLLMRALPGDQASSTRRVDVIAAVLCFGMFGLLIHALGKLAHAAAWWLIALELAVAIGCAVCLIVREKSSKAPIFPIDLFQNQVFSLSAATAVCAFTTQGLALVALPFHFHSQLGSTQVEIGFLIAPWPAMGALMAPFAGSLSDRFPAALLGGIGLILLAIGITALALLNVESPYPLVAICMFCCGLGFGLFLSPNQRSLMASAPPSRSGAASGVLGTTRLLGQATGASLVALALSLFADRGASLVLWGGAGFAVLGACLSLSRLLPRCRSVR